MSLLLLLLLLLDEGHAVPLHSEAVVLVSLLVLCREALQEQTKPHGQTAQACGGGAIVARGCTRALLSTDASAQSRAAQPAPILCRVLAVVSKSKRSISKRRVCNDCVYVVVIVVVCVRVCKNHPPYLIGFVLSHHHVNRIHKPCGG